MKSDTASVTLVVDRQLWEQAQKFRRAGVLQVSRLFQMALRDEVTRLAPLETEIDRLETRARSLK